MTFDETQTHCRTVRATGAGGVIILLSLCLCTLLCAHGAGAAEAASQRRQPDDSTRKLMAFDKDGEHATASEAAVGDMPGDVVAVKTSTFSGMPLVLRDGRVMLWSNAKEGEKWISRAVFSSDNCVTWSPPTNLFEFPPRPAQWSGQAGFVDQKGYLHLFGLEYYSFSFKDRAKSKSHLWHARSRDGGKTWDPVQNIPCPYSYVGCCSGAFETKNGRIIAPMSALSDRKVGVFVSLCPYSDDRGQTWHLPAGEIITHTGATDWYESGNAEPTGIQLKDGRQWLVTRSQDGFQWETFSQDNGLTWSPARPTRFVSNQSQMTVFRLADKRLLVVWNNCGAEGVPPVKWSRAERIVLAAAISADEGKTWQGYREIGRAVTADQLCNPHVAQMRNGRLLICAAGMFVSLDPEFLTRTSFAETFDLGLRRWSTLAAEGAAAAPHPDGGARQVLKLSKPKAATASAACLNFPFGRKGTITARLRVEPSFQGAHLTLSDHYDLPGLPRDASFPVRITAKGRIELNGSGGTWLATPGDLTPGKWHELKLSWDCADHAALLELDGEEIGRLHQYVCTDGVCYLRIRSTATATDDAGMFVESVKAQAPTR
jgi:hypothetical protein